MQHTVDEAAKEANKKIAEGKAKVKIEKAQKNLDQKLKEKEALTKGVKK